MQTSFRRLALIVALSALLAALLFRSYVLLHRYSHNGNLAPRYPLHRLLNSRGMFPRDVGSITPPTIETIQPWMTFDYLNRTFRLPADYLKTHVPVSATDYPNLSINRYVKANHLDLAQTLNAVKTALRTSSASSTSATSTVLK